MKTGDREEEDGRFGSSIWPFWERDLNLGKLRKKRMAAGELSLQRNERD